MYVYTVFGNNVLVMVMIRANEFGCRAWLRKAKGKMGYGRYDADSRDRKNCAEGAIVRAI